MACDSQRKILSHAKKMNQELNFVGAFLTERRPTSEPGCSEMWAIVARSSSRNDAPHRRPNVVSNEQEFPHFL